MRRRKFIGICIGLAAGWPLAALAEETAIPIIGYLSSKGPAAEATTVAAVRAGLAQNGFIEGRNVAIEFRWSDGNYERLPALAAELVDRKVRVLLTSGLPATFAAQKATQRIPIVFRLAVDPVAFGLVQNLSRPGGNLTGVTMLFDPLTPKKLQLLHELIPGATSVGFLINPRNPNATSHRQYAEAATRSMGLRVTMLSAGNPAELDSALSAARRQGIEMILVGDDPFFDVSSRQLTRGAAGHGIPTMYYVRDFTAAGGLMSYGPTFSEMAQQAGEYASQILKGADPAELPIRQPTKFELVINLKAANALGLAVPPSIINRADEVIE